MINYGFTDSMYSLAKLLAEESCQSQGLSQMLISVPKWEQFITKDVYNYLTSPEKSSRFFEYVKKISMEVM